jgi:D-amino-acid oxidase
MSTGDGRSNNAGPVVVVGAGVSGLTTAICLAEAGLPVEVWAADPPAQTTSVVAGALWGPAFQESPTQTLEWMAVSLREFQQLATVPDTGVRLAPVLAVGDLADVGELPPQADLIPDLRRCAAAQIPAGFRHGFHATMPLIDMPRYLEYLVGRLSAAGGHVDIRRVESLADAADSAPIVVNCAGLGARELAGDDTLEPMFGQHVVLSNPGLDQVFLELTEAEDWTCYFPHPQRVVCGGIRVPGRWDRTPEPEVTERILQRCKAVEPRLADAEVIEVVTGLRPGRPEVRVEVEPLGSAHCVHNYGHGSNGVTLSWGCARQAAKLALTSTASRD